MENSNDSRSRAIEFMGESGTPQRGQQDPGFAIAAALVYVGDRISELEATDMDRVAIELGGIATSISDSA